MVKYNNNKVLSFASRRSHLGCRPRCFDWKLLVFFRRWGRLVTRHLIKHNALHNALAHFDRRCFGDMFPRRSAFVRLSCCCVSYVHDQETQQQESHTTAERRGNKSPKHRGSKCTNHSCWKPTNHSRAFEKLVINTTFILPLFLLCYFPLFVSTMSNFSSLVLQILFFCSHVLVSWIPLWIYWMLTLYFLFRCNITVWACNFLRLFETNINKMANLKVKGWICNWSLLLVRVFNFFHKQFCGFYFSHEGNTWKNKWNYFARRKQAIARSSPWAHPLLVEGFLLRVTKIAWLFQFDDLP